MKLIFSVPPEADGALLRNFLRMCAISTELARAVKFHGSGFFAEGEPILANRRVAAGQDISFELPEDGAGVAPQPEIPVKVVYEDAFAIVLEKPPHLAVHPTLNYPPGSTKTPAALCWRRRMPTRPRCWPGMWKSATTPSQKGSFPSAMGSSTPPSADRRRASSAGA